ncbi:succinate--CoA ligase subunit alpha [Alloscardovia omnicolens]|uniref:succinate--CoA ligase subunit alpha n=1 Tax=Alloscardovia omnicolens TaxID=419015 RepID=UPI003A77379D
MSFVRPNAPVIVQGMTGHQGMTHTARMLKAGTNIVAGVNPRKPGQSLQFDDLSGTRNVPIYATCHEAREATGAEASVIFVPPRFAKSAMVEAIEAEIPLIVVITEGIPVADTAYCVALAHKHGVRIVGPNCPGLSTYTNSDEQSSGLYGVNLGIIPDGIVSSGSLGLVSKSGTLTYQLMSELADYGFRAAIGVGGDPIVGTTQQEALEILNNDPQIKACVLIGEIGGNAEQELAVWAKEHMTKPIVAYIAGYSAPEGKQMGHAGAIVSGGSGTAQGKKEALEACGIQVGRNPSETAQLMRNIMENL